MRQAAHSYLKYAVLNNLQNIVIYELHNLQ